jgi:DNA topoisomerase-1
MARVRNRLNRLFDPAEDDQTIVDPKDAAESAGLGYVSDHRPRIKCSKFGKGFTCIQPDGTILSDPEVPRRIQSLAIPPAWTDVWICLFADGHIQATGRDARGENNIATTRYSGGVCDSTNYDPCHRVR